MPLPRLARTLLTLLLLTLPTGGFAASLVDQTEPPPLNLALGLGLEFESGDFGTGNRLESWKVPLLVEWAPHERLLLAVEIPWLYQSSTGDVVVVGGTPTPIGRGNGMMGGSGSTTTSTTIASQSAESGLGDITVNAAFTLLQKTETRPNLLALAYAKLPTADEQRGLGTGEFDWGGGLGIGQHFGNWSTYAEALYITPGDSTLYSLDPYWEWLATLSYRIGDMRPGVTISGGTAPFNNTDNPLEIKARLTGLAGDRSSYSLYLLVGLSDASPDWGAGCTVFFDL